MCLPTELLRLLLHLEDTLIVYEMLSYYDNPNENSIFCPLHISAHYPGQMLIFLSRNAARKVSFTSHLLLLLFLQPQAAAQKFLTE